MRRLLPSPADDVDLYEVYAYPEAPPRGWWLRANMVATVDGATSDSAGLSGGISSEADKQIFRVLRGLADCVVVGAGTVRAEGYRAADVPIAIVSRSLDLPFESSLFTGRHRTIVITCESAPPDRLAYAHEVADVIEAGGDDVDLVDAWDGLVDRDFSRLLTEGGPLLLDQLTQAGLLDEICLTTSPRLVGGDAHRILDGAWLEDPVALDLHSLLEHEGVLFASYRGAD
ncbi:MAG: dihydrofolate reductase family protein [Candidatus Nanopelagicales bacterium]